MRRLLLISVLITTLLTPLTPAWAAHTPVSPFDDDPATTERVGWGATRYDNVVDISRNRFEDGAADSVVLATGYDFADALTSGSLLEHAPLLFVSHTIPDEVMHEIRRVLPQDRTVYIVGGEHVVGPEVERELEEAGYPWRRLAGETRIETALAVGDEVLRRFPGTRRASVARAWGTGSDPTAAWADSISAGGWVAAQHVPLVITHRDELHPKVDTWLDRHGIETTILFGGEAALSAQVEAAVPGPRRIAGPERASTAVAIAQELWGASSTGPRRFVIINGFGNESGIQDYIFGLPAAGIVADHQAPLLVVATGHIPEATRQLVSTTGCTPEVEMVISGMPMQVSDEREAELDRLDAGTC